MIKLFGALLIVISCTFAGFSVSSMYKKQAAQLEAFALLISHISAQINGFLMPLERIYDKFENAALQKCGFLSELRKCGGAKAVIKCRGSLCLTDNEALEILEFFEGVGNHSVDEEMRYCAYYEKKIAALAETARENLHGRTRICRSFGLLVGVMLAVLLL